MTKVAIHTFDYKDIHVVEGQEIPEGLLPVSIVDELERDGLIAEVVEAKPSRKSKKVEPIVGELVTEEPVSKLRKGSVSGFDK